MNFIYLGNGASIIITAIITIIVTATTYYIHSN